MQQGILFDPWSTNRKNAEIAMLRGGPRRFGREQTPELMGNAGRVLSAVR